MSTQVKPKKRELDMLHGSIWNKLPIFALPVAATAILSQLFNASDLAIVGNFASSGRTEAIAAVGANTSLISLLINLFIGVALGSTVVIANAIGQNDPERVQGAVGTSMTVAFWGGVALAILGQFFAEPILHMLLVPDEVMPHAVLYLRIYVAGMPAILLYNFESAIFRSVGETQVPLIALAISGILNVGLNFFFVLALDMAVEGVAIATVISNAVSALLLYRRLRITDLAIRVDPKNLRIHRNVLRHILKIGVPAGVQGAVFSLSNIVIQSAINSLGTIVMAGSSAAFNIEIITYNLGNSFSQACTTFVGQNFGAHQMRRCRKILYECIGEGALFVGGAALLILYFGRPMLAIFNSDPAVIEEGYTRLAYIVPAHMFIMLYEVFSGYLRGFGISLVPAVLTIIGVCGVRIVWVQTAFVASPTFATIMLVYPISLISTAVMMFIATLCYHPTRRFAKPTVAAEEMDG